MEIEIIEIEAESLDAAQAKLDSRITDGLCLVSREILSDDTLATVEAERNTTEKAFADAQQRIPQGAEVIEKKTLALPVRETIVVEAFDRPTAESLAESEMRSRFADDARLADVVLEQTGRKGLLGIGKSPNQYHAVIEQRARVEIAYKPKAKIVARIGKKLSLQEYIASLKHPNKDERDACIASLLEMDPTTLSSFAPDLVEPLVAAARWGHHYHEGPSRDAVKVLGKMGQPAVEPLLALLQDRNYRSVHVACIALAQTSDATHAATARSRLASYLEQGQAWPIAMTTVRAMAEIGDEHTIDLLSGVALQTHPAPQVRSAAATALGTIGDKRAVPALTKALDDRDRNVQNAVRSALDKLG